MIKLNVPVVAQKKSSTCWHAAAEMLWLYAQSKTGRAGPMNTLINNWDQNIAVSPGQFVTLAQKVGLKAIPNANHKNHTEESLTRLLNANGPAWCAGGWYGLKHIIVLTGVDKTHVNINDPDRGRKRRETIAWFNQKLDAHVAGCMMAKDPKRY